MRTSASAVAFGVWLAVCASASAKSWFPGVCSAFNGNGDSAEATITPGQVSLEILRLGGGGIRLRTTDEYATPHDIQEGDVGCKAFFDRGGSYVAVAFNLGGLMGSLSRPPEALRIIVASLASGKLVGDFTVKPRGTLRAPLGLAGFLGDGRKLAILGAWSQADSTISVATFGVTGKRDGPIHMITLPRDTEPPTSIDPEHNRIWLASNPQFCPLLSVTLVGPMKAGPSFDRPGDMCDAAASGGMNTAYPDANTLVAAPMGDEPHHVTRLSLSNGKFERIGLPVAPGNLTDVDKVLTSPDGKVIAVVRQLESTTFFGGGLQKGYRLDFVQVSPLKVLGHIRLPVETVEQSISFDHRDGVGTVQSYDGHRWRFHRLEVR